MNKKICCLMILILTMPITKVMSSQSPNTLKFNNASPKPKSNAQSVVYYSYNDTHLTMRYVSSPNQPAKSITIPWTPAQRKVFLQVLRESKPQEYVYVQGQDTKKNIMSFALPNDKKEL